MSVVPTLVGMVDTMTTRFTTTGLGTGDHGSTVDAVTTVIDAAVPAAEVVESLEVPEDAGAVAGPVAAAGPAAAAGPVAAVVADDC
tara:strand:+ start:10 stop:267 length:258 start_codon:yes stop_codon:yes gene_type:complete